MGRPDSGVEEPARGPSMTTSREGSLFACSVLLTGAIGTDLAAAGSLRWAARSLRRRV